MPVLGSIGKAAAATPAATTAAASHTTKHGGLQRWLIAQCQPDEQR